MAFINFGDYHYLEDCGRHCFRSSGLYLKKSLAQFSDDVERPVDLEFTLELGQPKEVELWCAWLNPRPTIKKGLERVVVWINKHKILSSCEAVAVARKNERRVEDWASEALTQLKNAIADNDYSVIALLTAYFEETEQGLDVTLRALEQKGKQLGLEGQLLLDQLRALSTLKRTDCLSGWDIEAIRRSTNEFHETLTKCKKGGEIPASTFALLEKITTYLTSAREESSKLLAAIAEKLGGLPELKASLTVSSNEIDQKAAELLSFLGRYNSNARRECEHFINWLK